LALNNNHSLTQKKLICRRFEISVFGFTYLMNSHKSRMKDLSGGVHYFVKVMNAERNNHAGVAEMMHVL
jgi:hypothetical protein